MKKLFTLLILTFLPLMASAYDAEIDGIYYDLDSSGGTPTATVTYKDESHGSYFDDVVIPEFVTYNDVTYSVITIGAEAFRDSYITSVTIPNSVTTIGMWAFLFCENLSSVHISSLESWCNISIEDSGAGFTSPLEYAHHLYLNGEEIKDLVIPNSVTSILYSAFRGGYFTSITIPNSVTSIGQSAFAQCSSLISITIPNSVTSIGDHAFAQCSSLSSINIPNSVTSIGMGAFEFCSKLISVTIPNSVTSIGECAFNICSGLASVTIGNSVKTIGFCAFGSCEQLTDVYCQAKNVPYAFAETFAHPEFITLHVPEGCVDKYRAAEPWNQFKEIISMAEYSLTYMVDGEVYKISQLAEGTAITPEPAPTKEGYDFSGWSTIPATMPAENVTITGTFSLITDEDEITIKDIGKTTWCSKYDLDFTNVTGIKAYIAMGYDDVDKTIWLARVMKVPAGTGLLVKGDAGTYKIPHVNVRAYYTNLLVGNVGEAIKIEETDGDKTNYYLSGKDGTFVSVNGNANIGKNKAYLQLPTSVFSGTRSIGINYDDEDGTTGIKDVKSSSVKDGEWYTLQGQRVVNPGKGLYIRNGKVVVIK